MKAILPAATALMIFAASPVPAEESEGFYLDGPADLRDAHQGPFPTGSDCLTALRYVEAVLDQKHIVHAPLYCSYYSKYYWLVEDVEMEGTWLVTHVPYASLEQCREARAKHAEADERHYYCTRVYPNSD
jgi:hypothetical protein